jgi:hypothetical protein
VGVEERVPVAGFTSGIWEHEPVPPAAEGAGRRGSCGPFSVDEEGSSGGRGPFWMPPLCLPKGGEGGTHPQGEGGHGDDDGGGWVGPSPGGTAGEPPRSEVKLAEEVLRPVRVPRRVRGEGGGGAMPSAEGCEPEA